VSQETDPSGSTVSLNGADITKYETTNIETTTRKNVTKSREITYQNWQVSAMVHTHNDRHDDYSISSDILSGQYGGDYGIAADGISVYLVPTTSFAMFTMFRLDLSPDDKTMNFSSVRDGQDYMNQQKKTIYLNGGKVGSIYLHGKKVQ
jgi:hypothetical protein